MAILNDQLILLIILKQITYCFMCNLISDYINLYINFCLKLNGNRN